MKQYLLNKSPESESVSRRVALLTELLKQAEKKITHISEVRQRNLNYAVVIFAGLFTFTMKFPLEVYSVFVAGVLLGVVI